MILSSEEIKTAQGLIAQYQRFARQWHVLRWLMLLAGVLMLVIMVFVWRQLEMLESFDATALPGEPFAKEFKAMLNERIDMLRVEIKLYFAVYLHAVLGPILIMASLYGWNRWPLHAALKAKLLEAALEQAQVQAQADAKTLAFMREEDA